MDPQKMLNTLCGAILENDVELAREALESLYVWIARGGFRPDVAKAIQHAWEEHK